MVVVIWVLLSFEMLLLIVLIITSTQIHVHYNWDQLNARNFLASILIWLQYTEAFSYHLGCIDNQVKDHVFLIHNCSFKFVSMMSEK